MSKVHAMPAGSESESQKVSRTKTADRLIHPIAAAQGARFKEGKEGDATEMRRCWVESTGFRRT